MSWQYDEEDDQDTVGASVFLTWLFLIGLLAIGGIIALVVYLVATSR